MTAAVAALFSAGKDSALAAHLLDHVHDVVVCHCTLDVLDGADTDSPTLDGDSWPAAVGTDSPPTAVAARAAEALDFHFETVELDPAEAREHDDVLEPVDGTTDDSSSDGQDQEASDE